MTDFESLFERAKKFDDPLLMKAYSDLCRDQGKEEEADFWLFMLDTVKDFYTIPEMGGLFQKMYAGVADFEHTGKSNDWYELYRSFYEAINEPESMETGTKLAELYPW